MGLDCYIRANEQTDEEKAAQITGFDITKGDVGYLRESIGGIHAATWLFPEAFQDEDGNFDHARKWYGGGGEYQMADAITRAFEHMAEDEGASITIEESQGLAQAAGGFPPDGYCVEAIKVEKDESWTYQDSEGEMHTEEWVEVSWRIPVAVLRRRLPLVEALVRKRYEDDPWEEQAVKSYWNFVAVYEVLEAEGREPSIYVSW